MGVCSYHSINIQTRLEVKDEENEALYLQTTGKYSREEWRCFKSFDTHKLGFHIPDNHPSILKSTQRFFTS
jgi:hypothetical protein